MRQNEATTRVVRFERSDVEDEVVQNAELTAKPNLVLEFFLFHDCIRSLSWEVLTKFALEIDFTNDQAHEENAKSDTS